MFTRAQSAGHVFLKVHISQKAALTSFDIVNFDFGEFLPAHEALVMPS